MNLEPCGELQLRHLLSNLTGACLIARRQLDHPKSASGARRARTRRLPLDRLELQPRVLVIDDNANFVKTMVESLKKECIAAHGLSDISEVFRAARRGDFAKYDLIFSDMRLGIERGRSVSAADVLLYGKTYSPNIRIIVFTQKDIEPAECVRCIQWGALGIIPKASKAEDFALIARVYPAVGDTTQVRERLISELWRMLLHEENAGVRGQCLEMLLINLFNSIAGFSVVANNSNLATGEVDLVIENRWTDGFWKALDSFHLVVECKSGGGRSEKEVFNVLSAKARRKGMCQVGILVAWEGYTEGFKTLQSARGGGDPLIYAMQKGDIEALIRCEPDRRAEILRTTFSSQL